MQEGVEWDYFDTYIETEYIRRGDKYDDKTLYPNPMHISPVYSNRSDLYRSIPEVLGVFNDLNNYQRINDYVEYHIYNVYRKSFPVYLKKVDSTSTSTPLNGAQFNLYGPYSSEEITAEGFNPINENRKWNTSSIVVEGESGVVKIGDLYTGIYYLSETKAPDGYNTLEQPVKIVVDSHNELINQKVVSYEQTGNTLSLNGDGCVYNSEDDSYQITVTNNPGVELPMTGGSGSEYICMIGGFIMLVSGLIIIRRRYTA